MNTDIEALANLIIDLADFALHCAAQDDEQQSMRATHSLHTATMMLSHLTGTPLLPCPAGAVGSVH